MALDNRLSVDAHPARLYAEIARAVISDAVNMVFMGYS